MAGPFRTIRPRLWVPPVGLRPNGAYPVQGMFDIYLLNEGGGVPRDLITNTATTLTGGPTWKVGTQGPCMNFVNANSNYVSIQTGTIFSNNATGSVAVWFRTTSTVSPIVMYADGNIANNYPLIILSVNSGTAGALRFAIRDSASVTDEALNSSAGINDGKWHLAVGICDKAGTGKISVYLDGLLSAGPTTITGSTTAPMDRATIGGLNRLSPTQYFDGDIGPVLRFKRALSSTEIQQLYMNPFGYLR